MSPNGTLDVELNKRTNVLFCMCFRDRYSFVKPNTKNQLKVQTFYKAKDIGRTMKASFKYLLFNHHERMFKLKHSSESRLLSPTSLANMDEVMFDIKVAIKCCVKLP